MWSLGKPLHRGNFTDLGLCRTPTDPYTVGQRATRIIQCATRAHTQSALARAPHAEALSLFHIEGREIVDAPKMDRVADRATAPRLLAPALHHPAQR